MIATKPQPHKHTFSRFARPMHFNGCPRYMLFFKCQTCSYSYAYDIVSDLPIGAEEEKLNEEGVK